MIPTLIFLLITTILGLVAYMYLRQEQDKFTPRNKHESGINVSKLPKSFHYPIKYILINAFIFCVSGGMFLIFGFLGALYGEEYGKDFFSYSRFFCGASLVALLSMAVSPFVDQIIFIVQIILNKIFQIYARNKIAFIFCIILGVIGVSVSIPLISPLNRGGCLWWECAPDRSFDISDLELPPNLFPANTRYHPIDIYPIYYDRIPEEIQHGSQGFRLGNATNGDGVYVVDIYSSSRNASRGFKRDKNSFLKVWDKKILWSKPEDINYISPFADQFYIACGETYYYRCVAIAQYQEFVLFLDMHLPDGMTNQDFQEIVIYMDKQISKYLHEK